MPSTAPVSVLIIDDDPESLEQLSDALAQPGLEILTASDATLGLEIACHASPRIVIATPQPGIADTLERVIEMDSDAHVIRLASHYPEEGDHIGKPVSLIELRERVTRLTREIRRRRSLHRNAESRPHQDFEGIVGRSPLLWEMFTRIRRIAPYYRAVLITGETGTGKDLAARALHNLSPVSKGRYVVLNCSAVEESLFESELFGHERGSFTGATHDRPGLLEHADGGTLFLDEIGDMPLGTQAKLLRVLQNQEVQRVGSLTTRKVDVRVVAATNHDLRALIAQKRFRDDLYQRISMVALHLPRLADRKEDLPLLERHFITRFAAEYGIEVRGITHNAHIRLSRHSWPGNVRELENVIGHAAMMTSDGMLDITDFPPYLQINTEQSTEDSSAALGETLHEHERMVLVRALEVAGGNQSKAARLLRIGRDALRYKLRKHNLDEPEPHQALAAVS